MDEHRLAHIARHQVTIEEVREIIAGDYAYIRGREDRWLLIGQTEQGRFLTVVVGERSQKQTDGLVTARPASREERSFFRELAQGQGGQEGQGGEEDDQNRTTQRSD
ncbi:MAG: BrnT family toxin [Chloroflexi bacterium]|nr:BrnT family toxin [Chloroflexota bacterium]